MTASAALEQKRDHARDDDRHQPRATSPFRAASRSTTRTTTATHPVHRRDRQVEQRRRDQGRPAARAGAARRVRRAASGSARRSSPDFPRRDRGHRLEPGAAERQRAGVGVDGLPGRRDAAADGRPRSARSPTAAICCSRASCAPSSRTAAASRCARKVVRRTISADTAATLTDDHGAGRRARHRHAPRRSTATRSPARPAPRRSWSTATTQKSDYNASFVGFIPSRNPALTIIVVIDSPHGNGYTGGAVAAPVFKRIAEAALHLPRRRPDHQRAAAGARGAARSVARRRRRAAAGARGQRAVGHRRAGAQRADARSARAERARSAQALSRIGMTAQMSGDGFVVEQSPPPGAPLDGGDVCRLVLERRPARRVPTASRP